MGLIPAHYRRDEDYARPKGRRPADWHERITDGKARQERRGCRPLDMDALIKRFGGPTHLARRLQRRGFHIVPSTVYKWRERGRMSSDWLGELVLMSAEEGRPIRLEDYVVGAPHRVARKRRRNKPKSLLD